MCNHSYVLVLQFRSTPELQSLRPASEGLELEIDSQLLTQVCWSVHLGPDLLNILQLSYDDAKVTIELWLTSVLQNILWRAHGFS